MAIVHDDALNLIAGVRVGYTIVMLFRRPNFDARTRACLLLAAPLALSACGTPDLFGGGESQPAQRAPAVVPASGAARAQALMDQSANQTGTDAALLRLEAALIYADIGELRRARQIANRIQGEQLSAEPRARLGELRARMALQQQELLAALNIVPDVNPAFSPTLNAQIQLTYARVLFGLGDTAEGVRALVEREEWLRPQEKRDNRDLIWAELSAEDFDGDLLSRADDLDATSEGWLELALIARSAWIDRSALDTAWNRWQQRFSPHPAQREYVERAETMAQRGNVLPGTIAVLLPMTGRFAAPAQAISSGLASSWYRAGAPGALKFYDTAQGLDEAVTAALTDGAELIVGPLSKPNVRRMYDLNTGNTPVLALNIIDTAPRVPTRSIDAFGNLVLQDAPAPTKQNFFQFSLAPEDEARSAAERAISNQQGRAIALIPESDWGRRTLDAFSERLQELGGVVIASRAYEEGQTDFGEEMRATLSLQASRDRQREVARALGYRPKFEPRRRSDIDAIFIAADAESGRLIKPQLKFHFAGDLPVYAMPRVYSGTPDRQKDRDLDGVRFPDMPWILSEDPDIQSLRNELAEASPAGFDRFPRLFAFGIDAFRLVPLVNTPGVAGSQQFVPATTGNLFIRPDGTIGRALVWAEFRRGEPVLLESTPVAGTALNVNRGRLAAP